jgi:hypothetical protein
MSDLTITNAGISVAKKTGGEVLSNNKKLNQMKVDVIDVTLTTTAATHSPGDVLAANIEIPNAVAVKGGSAIIQSVTLLDKDDEGPVVDLIFQSDNTALGSVGSAVSISEDDAEDILGFVSVSDYSDLIASQVAVKNNIGLVVKAASTTRSIFVSAVNRGSANYAPAATTDLKLKIGIVQD